MHVCFCMCVSYVCTHRHDVSLSRLSFAIFPSQLFYLLYLLHFLILICSSFISITYVHTYLQAGNMVNHHGSYTQQHVRSTYSLVCLFYCSYMSLFSSSFILYRYLSSHLFLSLFYHIFHRLPRPLIWSSLSPFLPSTCLLSSLPSSLPALVLFSIADILIYVWYNNYLMLFPLFRFTCTI